MIVHPLMQATQAGLPESPGWLPGAMMALGVALITTITLNRLRARSRRRPRAILPSAFTSASEKHAETKRTGRKPAGSCTVLDTPATRADLQALMVDVQEVTRQCAAQIENRAAMLDRLIADADRKINHLENLLREPSPQREGGAHGHSRVHILETQSPAPNQTPPSRTAAAPNDPLTRRVLEMASRGHSPLHIASVLDEQIGKVNLILAINAPAPASVARSG